jgi:hypothetical protein
MTVSSDSTSYPLLSQPSTNNQHHHQQHHHTHPWLPTDHHHHRNYHAIDSGDEYHHQHHDIDITPSTSSHDTASTHPTETSSSLSSSSYWNRLKSKIFQFSPSPSPTSSSPRSCHSDERENNNLLLGIYLFSSVFVAVANNITWKSTLDRFRAVDGSGRDLEFFVNQWTVWVYVMMAALILAYRWYAGYITYQQRQFPTRKFLFMGLFDAAAGLSSAIGGAHVTGQIQTLCYQTAIPSTMAMSKLFLYTRYSIMQYLGAAFILIGALFAAIPSASNTSDTGTTVMGLTILLIGLIPSSFSNVYKEAQFKTDGLDVYYLTVYVSFFQVVLGFCIFPILSLPGFGGIPLSEIPSNFVDGWRCFVGDYVKGFDCHVHPIPMWILFTYVIVNFAYNTLLLLITKHGSALLLVISSALALPVTNLIFTQKVFMGKHAEKGSMWNVIGLVVVVSGFLMYSLVCMLYCTVLQRNYCHCV